MSSVSLAGFANSACSSAHQNLLLKDLLAPVQFGAEVSMASASGRKVPGTTLAQSIVEIIAVLVLVVGVEGLRQIKTKTLIF